MTNEEIRRMTDDDLDNLITQKKNYLPEPIIPPIRPTKDIHEAACLLGQLERNGWERTDSALIRTNDFPHALVTQKAGVGIGFG
ncbi:MAG: hypothetical protein AAB401_16990, partial [Acidobacteriota bacterium]